MTPTPETLRTIAGATSIAGNSYIDLCDLLAAADAWETEQLEHASRIRGLDAAIEALRKRLEAGVLCDRHGKQTHAECPVCYDELSKRLEAAEKATNPEWPKGVTAIGYVRGGLWLDGAGCHWCSRRTRSPLLNHDGMCPVPLLASMLAALAGEETK